ncbi:MAG: polysaccharide deacetylase [Firmicutes bacterium]|nr:polysaccharide deacetylase [Bacillota bacterium]
MSIKRWKQVITSFVLLLIVSLIILAIILGLRINHYKNLIEEGALIDLTSYDSLSPTELSHLFKYLSSSNNYGSKEYQNLFPDLYVENNFDYVSAKSKVCYLTFDDGPNVATTTRVLDILKEHNIKATFFVIYSDGEEEKALYKRMIDEGHTIGVHSASHNYDLIYSSIDAYLTDFEKLSSHLEDITGVKPEVFRFPGGSINTYNNSMYRELIAEMIRRGYTYYDWNVSSGDATYPTLTKEKVIDNVLKGSIEQDDAIVLMHDSYGHDSTVAALPEIIKGMRNQGYSFAALDKTVTPWCFGY